MRAKSPYILFVLLFLSGSITSQKLKSGFDVKEYRELFIISVKTFYPSESTDIPFPSLYQNIYSSPDMGLSNKWELWIGSDKKAVISVRGTTDGTASSLANMYAAMVPAKGILTLEKDIQFNYELAKDPKAAVHIGWLVSMAYLSQDILPKIDSCYKNGIKDFYITGHSQGGAISYLLNAYLIHAQKKGNIPSDIQFKTYCTAGPKPGNQYFANEYHLLTQEGWGYNVINANDWVPESFLTVQTTRDYHTPNVFQSVKEMINKQGFFKRLIANSLYNRVSKPSLKAQRRYQRYFGKWVSKAIKKQLPGFEAPEYYPSGNYVQAGNLYVMSGDTSYHLLFPEQSSKLMQHHQPMAYYYLINQLIDKK